MMRRERFEAHYPQHPNLHKVGTFHTVRVHILIDDKDRVGLLATTFKHMPLPDKLNRAAI